MILSLARLKEDEHQKIFFASNEGHTLTISSGGPKFCSGVNSPVYGSAGSRGERGMSNVDVYIAMSVPFSRSC